MVARGAVTVLVSHDISLAASLCDRMLYLGEEAILGEPEQVFAELLSLGKVAFTPSYWEEDAP